MGRILTGGLRVLEELGETSAGRLFRAEGPDGEVRVALGIVRPERHGGGPSVGSADLARLEEQARRATRIQHPNVAAVYATGETEEGWLYLVLESLDGELLSEILASSDPVPQQEAMDYFRQSAAGLRAAHEAGIVHGNLSPHSILVTRTADGRSLVKLINFELAALPGHAPEPPGHREAMAEYASPERLAGQEPDARSDIFSLGAVLHHLLTGAPPRSAGGAPIPNAARVVLAQALAPAPGERFQTVSDFKRALWRATGRPGRSGSMAGRLILAGGSGIALGVVVAVGLWLWLNPAGERSGGDAESGARAPVAIEVPENRELDEAAPDSVPKPVPSRRARRPAPPPPEPEPDEAVGYAPEAPPPAQPQLTDSLPVVAPSVAERPTPVEAEAIDVETLARVEANRVVTRYARALETRDVVAVSRAYPGLTAEQRDAWELFFKVTRDLDVTLEIEQFSLADSLMQLGLHGEYQYWNRSLNRAERSPVSLSATLRRSGQGWRLAAVQ